ncbi:MAG: nucleotidyltransferase family protein [Flavobacteriaceae bacterium]
MQKTAVLILAAGSSSRMGNPKQLLPYKNTTLLGNAIEQAQKSNTNAVFCVLGANAEIIKKSIEKNPIETIYNPNYKDGLSSSIVTGIDYLSDKNFDAVLILLADQPKITSSFLNQLLKTSEENPSKIIACNYDKNIGVPAIFPKKYFVELLKLKGDKGAKEIINNHSSEIIKMASFNLIDIDTKEDYKNLIK